MLQEANSEHSSMYDSLSDTLRPLPETREQSLDMIINNLERAAAKAEIGPEDGDLPGDGVRGLAAKLRRKLHKTPPRWQVLFRVKTNEAHLCCFSRRQQPTVCFMRFHSWVS